MNFTRATLRLGNITSINTASVLKNVFGKRDFTRTLWHMSKKPESASTASVLQLHKPSLGCSCGCGMKRMHTKGERELVEFLTEEILAERKTQKVKTIPTKIDDFQVKLLGAEVELTKELGNETITVSFNVNHSVDIDSDAKIDPKADEPDMAEMHSKPRFEIDIKRGNTTLGFSCSFLGSEAQEGEYNDIFSLEEMYIYDGEWHEQVYAVAGDVLDGYLYDLLMNLLEEKGINNDFAQKIIDFSTAYEHGSYIALLERLSKFTTGNVDAQSKQKPKVEAFN